MTRPLAVIVLAAGVGKRTKVDVPKVLLPLCGRSLIDCVLDAVAELQPQRTLVVVSHQKERVTKRLESRLDLTFVDQGEPKGTGHAVRVAMQQLGDDFDGEVLITYGDMPLIRGETYAALRAKRGRAPAAVLTARVPDPGDLGRILRDARGELTGIREVRDATAAELGIDEVNCGVYCCDASALRPALRDLKCANAQGEYYLTDIVQHFRGRKQRVESCAPGDVDEVHGVNSLGDLALARALMQERILLEHMMNGVLIDDPSTTYIDHGVEIGAGTRILPCTVIGSGVVIGRGCEVGPFSHLRASAVLEDAAEVGNFVEVKKSRVGAGSKAKHLTYLGDATIGKGANIGAGTITANYDGVSKHPTEIGDGAFVGSGTVLVAPSSMGRSSMTGAGAVVTRGTSIGEGEVFVGVPARLLKKRGDSPAPKAPSQEQPQEKRQEEPR